MIFRKKLSRLQYTCRRIITIELPSAALMTNKETHGGRTLSTCNASTRREEQKIYLRISLSWSWDGLVKDFSAASNYSPHVLAWL